MPISSKIRSSYFTILRLFDALRPSVEIPILAGFCNIGISNFSNSSEDLLSNKQLLSLGIIELLYGSLGLIAWAIFLFYYYKDLQTGFSRERAYYLSSSLLSLSAGICFIISYQKEMKAAELVGVLSMAFSLFISTFISTTGYTLKECFCKARLFAGVDITPINDLPNAQAENQEAMVRHEQSTDQEGFRRATLLGVASTNAPSPENLSVQAL